VAAFFERSNGTQVYIKGGEFLDYVNNYQPFKRGYAPCNYGDENSEVNC
jgi:hypothetical protein